MNKQYPKFVAQKRRKLLHSIQAILMTTSLSLGGSLAVGFAALQSEDASAQSFSRQQPKQKPKPKRKPDADAAKRSKKPAKKVAEEPATDAPATEGVLAAQEGYLNKEQMATFGLTVAVEGTDPQNPVIKLFGNLPHACKDENGNPVATFQLDEVPQSTARGLGKIVAFSPTDYFYAVKFIIPGGHTKAALDNCMAAIKSPERCAKGCSPLSSANSALLPTNEYGFVASGKIKILTLNNSGDAPLASKVSYHEVEAYESAFEERLKSLVAETKSCIETGDYSSARLPLAQLSASNVDTTELLNQINEGEKLAQRSKFDLVIARIAAAGVLASPLDIAEAKERAQILGGQELAELGNLLITISKSVIDSGDGSKITQARNLLVQAASINRQAQALAPVQLRSEFERSHADIAALVARANDIELDTATGPRATQLVAERIARIKATYFTQGCGNNLARAKSQGCAELAERINAQIAQEEKTLALTQTLGARPTEYQLSQPAAKYACLEVQDQALCARTLANGGKFTAQDQALLLAQQQQVAMQVNPGMMNGGNNGWNMNGNFNGNNGWNMNNGFNMNGNFNGNNGWNMNNGFNTNGNFNGNNGWNMNGNFNNNLGWGQSNPGMNWNMNGGNNFSGNNGMVWQVPRG